MTAMIYPTTNPAAAEQMMVTRGEGPYIFDQHGKRYLEGMAGLWCTALGYGNEEIIEVAQQQMRDLSFSHMFGGKTHAAAIELADKLAAMVPMSDGRVFLGNSGSDANDTLMKLIRYHAEASGQPNRIKVIAREQGYHGVTLASAALTAIPTNHTHFQLPFEALGVLRTGSANYYRGGHDGESESDFVARRAQELEALILAEGPDTIAAMIAEPIQGVGGFATPPDGFFGAMSKELANREILFISDEVQTGWGRTGEHFWGYQAHGIVPDILTFAKGVGNGITLAGVVARAEIMDCIDVLSFSTFGGNPLSAAAGRATLKYVLDNDLQGNAKQMGERLTARLGPVIEATPWIAELRGRGLMQAIEIVHPGGIEPDSATTARLLDAAKDRGLLVGKGGLYGNVIRMAPMLAISEAELDDGIDALIAAIGVIDGEH